MPSVTQIVRSVSQPKDGYLPVSQFQVTKLFDDKVLSDIKQENIQPFLVGRVVDCLVRYMLTEDVYTAFEVSEKGYWAFSFQKYIEDISRCSKEELSKRYFFLSETEAVRNEDLKNKIDFVSLRQCINGLDNESITAACRAVSYDDYTRGSSSEAIPAISICPNQVTIDNIRIMVERCVSYIESLGGVVETGFNFEGGYSDLVNAGDGDILTKDTLCDIKVSIKPPTEDHTLQVLMYWIMGQHSGNEMFANTRYISLLNPRRGEVYTIDTSRIDSEIITMVEKEVLNY